MSPTDCQRDAPMAAHDGKFIPCARPPPVSSVLKTPATPDRDGDESDGEKQCANHADQVQKCAHHFRERDNLRGRECVATARWLRGAALDRGGGWRWP